MLKKTPDESRPTSASLRQPAGRSAARKSRPSPLPDYRPEETIGFLLWDTVRTFHRTFQTRIAKHGINFGMWPYLRALWEQDGITQRELSRRVRMTPPTTLNALVTLERAGIVRRERDPSDKRKIRIFLTRKGQNLFHKILPEIDFVNRKALRGISGTDEQTIKELLKRMRSNFPAP